MHSLMPPVNSIANPIGRMSTDTMKHSQSDRKGLKGCLSSGDLKTMSDGGLTKNVSFHQIEIREYERSLGDNPSVRSGPPISLGWNYNPNHTVVELEDYERLHSRRDRSEIIMPQSVREDILKDAGVSRQEMSLATKSATEIKNRRAKVNKYSRNRDKVDYAWENFGRKFKGVAKKLQQRRRSQSVAADDSGDLYVSQSEEITKSMSLCNLRQIEETKHVEHEDVVKVAEGVVEKQRPSTGGFLVRAGSQSCGNLSNISATNTDQLNEMSAISQPALETGTIEIRSENGTTTGEDWSIGEFNDDGESPPEYVIPVLFDALSQKSEMPVMNVQSGSRQ
jgi:hypothetical protein